ncbi:MAG: hypothetical protein R2800_14410 [Flavipsychrobacter sp.]
MRLYHKKITNIEQLRTERKKLDKQATELLPDIPLFKKEDKEAASFLSNTKLLSLALPLLKQALKNYDNATLTKITAKFIGKYLKWEIKATLLNALLDLIIPSKKAKEKTTS